MGFDSIPEGATINLNTIPTLNLNIRANTLPSIVESVRFDLDGVVNYHTESGAPYALAGDSSGDYAPWTPGLGSHTLTATPFEGAGASGQAGQPLTLDFTVIQ